MLSLCKGRADDMGVKVSLARRKTHNVRVLERRRAGHTAFLQT